MMVFYALKKEKQVASVLRCVSNIAAVGWKTEVPGESKHPPLPTPLLSKTNQISSEHTDREETSVKATGQGQL